MKIKATTKIYGIFGHPVGHSLSPLMHNAAFEELKLNCVYVAFDINPKDIKTATESIKTMGISGVNVTIPHKETILRHLDSISPEARLTGAVNTVKNDGGKLYGFNTDVEGFLKAIKWDLGLHPEGLRVILLGAGGASRAVITALCMNQVSEIFVLNRTLAKAEKLATEFKNHFKKITITPIYLEDKNSVKKYLKVSDLVINATSSGMGGVNHFELPLENLRNGSMIYDLVYKPRETALVKSARELGHKTSDGLSMLIYQGAESFEIWTGKKAPIEVMRKAIE